MVSNVTQVRPASLACTECRAKHLKCDGGSPSCSRCVADGLQCVYQASRRGYGRRRMNANGKKLGTPSQSNPVDAVQLLTPESASSTSGSVSRPRDQLEFARGHEYRSSAGSNTLDDPTSDLTGVSPTSPPEAIDRELLVKTYYAHFHPSHPLLVPCRLFSRQRYPEYLQWTVFFIAQQYTRQASAMNRDVEATVKTMLAPGSDEITVHRVQALVLYTIVLHSLHRPHEALECIQRACQISNALGLHQADFSSWNEPPQSVEEESIRRTWWELYVLETYLAALHRRPSLLPTTEGPYPLLPSSEKLYNAGDCERRPPSLALFENRAFAHESLQRHFSPHCYRVEAIRLVSRVMDLYEHEKVSTTAVQDVETAIASWKYYLPDRMTDGTDLAEIDPLILQAHFFIHTASIFLHFPRSDLPPKVPSAADIACVRGHTRGIPSLAQHTKKAIAASREIANLAVELSSTDTCPPLFTCALILACIVQLAASSLERSNDSGISHYRDRVVLLLGVLTELGHRWTVARNALPPLKQIADTIFGESRTEPAATPEDAAIQEGYEAMKDVAGIPWFDLFSMDELMADFTASEPGGALQSFAA